MIRLACQADIPEILPAAWYDVSRLATAELSNEEGHDGHNRRRDVSSSIPLWSVDLTLLTHSELERLPLAKCLLLEATHILIHIRLPRRIDAISCFRDPLRQECGPSLATWLVAQANIARRAALYNDPMKTLMEMKRALLQDSPLDTNKLAACFLCRRELAASIDRARDFLWQGIPYWFELKPYHNHYTMLSECIL